MSRAYAIGTKLEPVIETEPLVKLMVFPPMPGAPIGGVEVVILDPGDAHSDLTDLHYDLACLSLGPLAEDETKVEQTVDETWVKVTQLRRDEIRFSLELG